MRRLLIASLIATLENPGIIFYRELAHLCASIFWILNQIQVFILALEVEFDSSYSMHLVPPNGIVIARRHLI